MKPTTDGLPLTLPFDIPAYWTPEPALAVVELLDELRELIWNHYGLRSIDEAREQQKPRLAEPSAPPTEGPGF
jgi:hypothetical protein